MPAYPVTRPSITGTNITVDYYSKNPLLIARVIQEFRQGDYFLSDLLFHDGGTAESGAVIYFPVLTIDDQFVDVSNGMENVNPGDEYPVIGVNNIPGVAATTQKRGFKMKITREMKTRNLIGRFRSQVQAMYNSAKVAADTRAMAAINAAPFLSQAESASWATSTTKIRNDVQTARNAVENSQLGKTQGYRVDTMILGSNQWLNLTLNDTLMDSYYRAQVQAGNLLNMGVMDGLLGIPQIRVNPFIPANDRWLFDSTKVGTKATEYPLTLNSWEDPNREITWTSLSESDVYMIEAPKALIKIV